ncbi:cathepsin S-like [Pelobates cultripes]|uniref:Cathepsin S-like n=2 Tax=Pelobates cultripes TaxID=61616 RepID=A0AAD1RKV1_PELCU|nr:cathepsin S-like [Pelobates cultripes]CAH2273501.1 cathepsin S-like [Pelobates cultripes]
MQFNKCLFVFSTIVICASAAHFLEQEWNVWKSKHGKEYVTEKREMFRRKAWEATWDMVQKHNQRAEQGLETYTLAMNQFADLTPEERKQRSCFRLKNEFIPSNRSTIHHRKLTSSPDTVDWREKNCNTPIKSQGLCGSCWAFAVVGVIESRYCIQTGKLIRLSEQQLVDCDATNHGCCGGKPTDALAYTAEYGIMRNRDYEYAEKQSECAYDEDKAIMLNVEKYYNLAGEENMAREVELNGPIIVGIAASEKFMFYKEGVYNGDCAEEPNHAIIIVGYGSQPSEDDPDEIEDYWIIRNSWGETWGEHGYGKMKRNVNQCDIGSNAAAIDLTGL